MSENSSIILPITTTSPSFTIQEITFSAEQKEWLDECLEPLHFIMKAPNHTKGDGRKYIDHRIREFLKKWEGNWY